MRKAPGSIVLAALAALLPGSACVDQGQLGGPPYDVLVLDRVEGGSSFALQTRQLQTVDDLDELSSPAFQIRQGGTLQIEVRNGEPISSGSYSGSHAPNLRYVVEDGVALPRDYTTLLLFSGAYHFERVLEGLRSVVDPTIRGELDALGALEIVYDARTSIAAGGAEATLRLEGNAFFSPADWQFGIAGSSPRERVPLCADARVIAHELGHSVFQQAFFGGKGQDCDPDAAAANAGDPHFTGRWDLELAINGFNEGFADWLSFAITGGVDPLEVLDAGANPALDVNVNERILTEDNYRWDGVLKFDDSENETRCQSHYCIGTLFARSLVAAYRSAGHELSDEVARHDFSRLLVSALDATPAALAAQQVQLAEPELARCESRSEPSLAHDPPVIGAFLQAFLHGLPADTRSALCAELIERFAAGFPVQHRAECEP